MKKILFGYMSFIIFFLFISLLFAQEAGIPLPVEGSGMPFEAIHSIENPGIQHPPGMGFSGAEKIFAFIDELNLSEEQIDKLKDIRKKSKREIEELRHKIKLAIWDIQDEFANKNPDKNKIDSTIEKISDYQKNLMKIRINQMFEIKKILTDEQYKKLITHLETGIFKMKKEMKKKKK